ncbi:MAG: RNA polymerase sigma factor, partial [Clostridia bacterium]|nr:RNA polymerase sigma factor [Clostridia bacterium]
KRSDCFSERSECMRDGEDSYRRFLDGDKNAISEIVEAYRAGLEYFLLSVTGDENTAEELTQDTFVYLFVKKPKYKNVASFNTWLYTIGKHRAYKHMKKCSRCVPTEISSASLFSEDLRTLEEKYFSDMEKQNVLDVMGKLKSEYREILWLTYFEELSNKECAEILKKNVHSIEVLLSRARQALKKLLQEEGYTYEN